MLVSVVIPSYNHRQYVAQAIESVLNQSWPHIDLIVIDDGSKDGSVEVIREIHERRGGFRFVARENRGLIRTLNEGLRLAEGKFFCELASDDYFPVDSIELRATFLGEHPECVAVFGDGFLVEMENQTGGTLYGGKRRPMFAEEDPIPDMISGKLPVFSTGLIRTDVLHRAGGFDEENFRYYEDLDTPIRLALEGRLGYIDKPVICRRHHETNVSGTTSHIRLEKVLCYSKLLKDFRLTPYRKILHKRFRRSLLALGRHLETDGGRGLQGRRIFRDGWGYLWRDPRLLRYLLKWGL